MSVHSASHHSSPASGRSTPVSLSSEHGGGDVAQDITGSGEAHPHHNGVESGAESEAAEEEEEDDDARDDG